MLDKLLTIYALFIATIDNKQTNYIFVDLLETIYKIKQFFKGRFT